jgi:hypothetical protein
MKRLAILLFVLFSFLFIGCAGQKVKRVVQDNIFYSSNEPEISIKVDPNFKYLGKTEESKYGEFENLQGNPGPQHKRAFYIFGEIGDNNTLKKAIGIDINSIDKGYFLPDLFDNVKYKLDSGTVKIGGEIYEYFITPRPSLPKIVRKAMKDKGYVLSNCYMYKVIGTIFGPEEQDLLKIYYAEDVYHINGLNYRCKDWRNKELLEDDQKTLLKKFDKRANGAFRIMEYFSPSEKKGDVALEQAGLKVNSGHPEAKVTTATYESKKDVETEYNSAKLLYDSGDYENAFRKWHSLAKRGDAESAFRIAGMYDFAEGVKQNYVKSSQWYLFADERGYGEAQCKIANRFNGGIGIRRDLIQAYKWYRLCLESETTKASGTSFHHAESAINAIISVGVLSPSQVEYAESLAREWEPKPNLR